MAVELRRPPSCATVVLVIASACFGEAPSVGDQSSGDVASTTGDPTADAGTASAATEPSSETDPCAGVCTQAVPDGWTGPLTVHVGSVLDCPPGWPTEVLTAFADVVAPPASCSCDCAPPPLACQATLTQCDVEVVKELPPGECVGLELFREGAEVQAAGMPAPDPGECEATVVTELPDPAPSTPLVACGLPADAAACGDGLCAPPVSSPFPERLCILREGEHACPDAYAAVQPRYYTEIEDSRSCEACTCGPASGMICGAGSSFAIHARGDCSDEAVSTLLEGMCQMLPMGAMRARYVPVHPGQCSTLEQSEPAGTATPSGVITLCCTS